MFLNPSFSQYHSRPFEIKSPLYTCGLFRVSDNELVDDAFARAEDPTHTKWTTNSLESNYARPVNFALNKVKDLWTKYIENNTIAPTSSTANSKVSQQLKHLGPRLISESEPVSRTSKRKKTPSRAALRKVDISAQFIGVFEGKQRQYLAITIPEHGERYKATISLMRLTDSGREEMPRNEYEVIWEDNQGLQLGSGTSLQMRRGESYRACVIATPQHAFDIEVEVNPVGD